MLRDHHSAFGTFFAGHRLIMKFFWGLIKIFNHYFGQIARNHTTKTGSLGMPQN
jgi:hypothetical protein